VLLSPTDKKRKEHFMRITLSKATEEFLAKIYCDLGKNIVSIGFASYFFKDLALPFRIGFVILGLSLLILSVYVFSKQGEK
jgi:hypothetical protein